MTCSSLFALFRGVMRHVYLFSTTASALKRDSAAITLRKDGFTAYTERDGGNERLVTDATLAQIALSVGCVIGLIDIQLY